MNPLVKVRVNLIHDDCWTSELNMYKTFTINYSVYPNKGYLRSRIIVPKELKQEVQKMKESKGILKVEHVQEMDKYILVDFLNRYNNSIAGYLYDNEVMFISNKIEGLREIWEFIAPRSRIREIIEGLKGLSKVENVEKSEVKIDFFPNLTETQLKILLYALKYGYLDYPRRANADDIADKLGLSKITFLYHLRLAERKLIEHYLSSYK